MQITITDDFDLYKITYSGQCFRAKQIDDNTFSFVYKNYFVTISDLGNNLYDISCNEAVWNEVWYDYFDLGRNYSKIRKSIPEDDSYMIHASEIGKGIRILKQDKFEALISFIISQRKSIPAIKSSVEKLCNLYGKDGFFPSPIDMLNATSEELSSCGLGYRVSYIMDCVCKIALCEVDLESLDKLSDEDLILELKKFNGVGDKVANCVALFAYHRIGNAPIDTWIAKVIAEKYNNQNPFPAYGEVAGIMQQYVFYAAQHMKDLS